MEYPSGREEGRNSQMGRVPFRAKRIADLARVFLPVLAYDAAR